MPRSQAVAKKSRPAQQPAPKPAQQAAAEPERIIVRKVTPVRSQRRALETSEQQIGQDHPRVMKSGGKAKESIEPQRVQRVDRPVSQTKLEALRFGNEVLTIMVHDTTNPLDEPFPEVWNDGKPQRFRRGVEMQVKRKYVEVLARAKKTVFSQTKEKDDNGTTQYVNHPHTALKYPFSVLHDPNPRGRDWLKSILAEA